MPRVCEVGSICDVYWKRLPSADTLLLFKYVIVNPAVSDLVVPWIVRRNFALRPLTFSLDFITRCSTQ